MQMLGVFFDAVRNSNHIAAGFSERGEGVSDVLTQLSLTRTMCVRMEQVHGNGVAEISERDLHSVTKKALTMPGVDAVYTRLTNVSLVVRWADCLPILFAHSSGLIGAVHAGRKGTEASVAARVLKQVVSEVEVSARSPLHIWLGPCICHQCYQIDRAHNTHYDLLNNNQLQITSVLRNQNLPDSSFQVALDKSCTHCSADQFYSYRKEGAGVAMNYAVIARVNQPSISAAKSAQSTSAIFANSTETFSQTN